MSSKDMGKSETAKEDKVNHPRHYDLPGGGQTIDVIDDMLDDAEIEGYYKGNIIKYIARYKKKGGAESLKKARWYLDKLIALKMKKVEKVNQLTEGDRVIISVPREYIINMRGNDMMSAIRNNGKIGEILQDMNNDTYIVKVGDDVCNIVSNFLKAAKKNG
ncbi:MAG: DUF3310 domain-containing protein [Dialister sp.]|nr:DUF3310 domain-containing protein [Dialister sp.]MDY6116107.1 DUF3310 domain-containing protein [Dialister sp.]